MSLQPKISRMFPGLFEQLEDRVLFDAVPDAAFIIPEIEHAQSAPAQFEEAQEFAANLQHELVLIDAGVEDPDSLLDSILESRKNQAFVVKILDGDSDGVEQVSKILAESTVTFSAVHVLSHGSDGSVALGNTRLTNGVVANYADQLSLWSEALTEDADLLFYGCELAQSSAGLSLVETISEITGTDVAASDDVTGNVARGGDWYLEIEIGDVSTAALSAQNYQGTLVDTNDDAVIVGSNDSLAIDVFDNDRQIGGLIPSVVNDPANGTAVVQGDGTILYTPDANFSGQDEFTYSTEPAPTLAANDDSFIITTDTAPTLSILANDTFRGAPTVNVISGPSNGALLLNADNTVTYTPTIGFAGDDQFTYSVTDITGTSTATVFLEVSPNPLSVHYIPPRISGHSEPNNPIELTLNTASVTPVNVTITVPGSGNPPITRTITVYDGDESLLIDAGFGEITSNATFAQVQNSGILVEADGSVFVAARQDGGNAQSFLATKGTNAIGQEFYAGGITAEGAWDNDGDGVAFLSLMATEDTTTVTIDRPVGATWGWRDGADPDGDGTITVLLNAGET